MSPIDDSPSVEAGPRTAAIIAHMENAHGWGGLTADDDVEGKHTADHATNEGEMESYDMPDHLEEHAAFPDDDGEREFTLIVDQHVRYQVTVDAVSEKAAREEISSGYWDDSNNWVVTDQTTVLSDDQTVDDVPNPFTPEKDPITPVQQSAIDFYDGYGVKVKWFTSPTMHNGDREFMAVGDGFIWSILVTANGEQHTQQAANVEFSTGLDI